jgi:hypothetical protein
MKCMDCPLKYIGQTGRTFNTRYKEHIHNIRSNNSNTEYANHILNTGHTYGTITDTMEIIKTERKGRYLNTLERYIYEIRKDNLHINDTNIDIHNPIFKALYKIYTKLQYIPPPTYSQSTTPNQATTKQYKYGKKFSTNVKKKKKV